MLCPSWTPTVPFILRKTDDGLCYKIVVRLTFTLHAWRGSGGGARE